MRRMMTIVLAGAMSALSASAVFAQQSQRQGPPRGERMAGRGPMAGLFEGITLTSAQQERVHAILEAHRPEGGRMGRGGEGRAMRGDTAAMRQRREQRAERGDTIKGRGRRGDRPAPDPAMLAQMREERQAMISEVRAVLTPAQRQVFDTNVAAMEKRFQEGRGGRGEGRQDRS